MKIGITGHTKGLGKAIFDYYSVNNEVIGFSRSNTYDVNNKFYEIIDIVKTCDLFFNNAYSGIAQSKFLLYLGGIIPIVTSGSKAALYPEGGTYQYQKHILEKIHYKVKNKTDIPMLLLRMDYLENFNVKNPIKFAEVIEGVEFWLKHPGVTMIEFNNSL